MKRLACVFGVVVMAAACGSGSAPAEQAAPAAAPATSSGDQLDIRLSSPGEPTVGENTFEVMVMQGGTPVADADVSLELFMAAMPSMNMPEMRINVPLAPAGEGRYRGTGTVSMGGAWDANVMVMRGGQHLGDEKITIVAK
jgi:nitrogen fixation protein FixH